MLVTASQQGIMEENICWVAFPYVLLGYVMVSGRGTSMRILLQVLFLSAGKITTTVDFSGAESLTAQMNIRPARAQHTSFRTGMCWVCCGIQEFQTVYGGLEFAEHLSIESKLLLKHIC